MSNEPGTNTWPELAAGLYEALTGRNAEICYEFENMNVHVPASTGDDAKQAHWKLDGTLKIRTRNLQANG